MCVLAGLVSILKDRDMVGMLVHWSGRVVPLKLGGGQVSADLVLGDLHAAEAHLLRQQGRIEGWLQR